MNVQDNIVDYKEIGQRIRKLRKDKKYTQDQVAKMVGISCSYVGHIERGIKAASLETMAQLCKILDVDMHYLVFGYYSTANADALNEHKLINEFKQLLKRHNLI